MVDTLFDSCARNAATIEKIDCFKNWIRTCVRPLLPHGALACVHGRTHGLGVSVEYIVTVDFPVEYLSSLDIQPSSLRHRKGGEIEVEMIKTPAICC